MSQNISVITPYSVGGQIFSKQQENNTSGASFADQLAAAKATTSAVATTSTGTARTTNALGMDSSLFASMLTSGNSDSMYSILSFILMFILMDQDNNSAALPSSYLPDFSVSDYEPPNDTAVEETALAAASAAGTSGRASTAGSAAAAPVTAAVSAEKTAEIDKPGTAAASAVQNAAADTAAVSGKNYGPIVNSALTRLGDPYSQARAGQGDYTDCSYLSRWCYREAGVELPRTAAAQAKWCVDNGKTVSKSELQPGDLVFFSLHENDRYMDITHVGIYAGNNMMVDASSIHGKVVYRQLFGGQVLYGRPR